MDGLYYASAVVVDVYVNVNSNSGSKRLRMDARRFFPLGRYDAGSVLATGQVTDQ